MHYNADYVFYDGDVITVNQQNEVVEAVAVKGNRIIFAGEKRDIESYIGSDTKKVDLNGRCLIPGFIDSHIHFGMLGLKQGPIIDIDYCQASSIIEIKEKISQVAKQKQPGEWIACWGYDQNKLKEGRHPTKEDLDEAAPDNPVRCTRCCGHMGVYNSYALQIIGVKTENFSPGEVVMANGNYTGLLKENAHMMAGQSIQFSDAEILNGLIKANDEILKMGITSIHDAGSDGSSTIRVMEKAIRKKLIHVRIYSMIFDLAGKDQGVELINHYIATGLSTGFGNAHFSVGPIKIMIDGSSSGPSSATSKPYSHDPNLKGILVWSQEEADEVIAKAHNAGFQVTAHALGDLAIDIMLNAIEKALIVNPRKNHRHRIEHCGLPTRDQIKRIKRLGIIPVPNPGFIVLNGKDYNRFYGDRVNYMFPLKTYLEEGIIAAIGSDSPVITYNPMFGITGALLRQDGNCGDVVGSVQKIRILDAIRMYTLNGAYAAFEEKIKGSIEVNKLADLVILSENILKIPEEMIMDVKADLTMINGEVVYSRI